MNTVHSIEFHQGSKEERLPNFSADFPYTVSRSELDRFTERSVPWHWHKSLELFYTVSGCVEYHTPACTLRFPAGTGGIVNSNVLHSTRACSDTEPNTQLIHLFDPSLLSGAEGGRIEQRYLSPILNAPQIELIPLLPIDEESIKALSLLKASYELSPSALGYELKLRNALSELWLRFFTLSQPLLAQRSAPTHSNDKLKEMLVYIHDHYAEPLSVQTIAASAYLSERACYRAFRELLHTTPTEYLQSYRLRAARRLLAETQLSITEIGQRCGLGSSSYFGHVFRQQTGCTPSQYREKWQNIDNQGQKSDSAAIPPTV